MGFRGLESRGFQGERVCLVFTIPLGIGSAHRGKHSQSVHSPCRSNYLSVNGFRSSSSAYFRCHCPPKTTARTAESEAQKHIT